MFINIQISSFVGVGVLFESGFCYFYPLYKPSNIVNIILHSGVGKCQKVCGGGVRGWGGGHTDT